LILRFHVFFSISGFLSVSGAACFSCVHRSLQLFLFAEHCRDLVWSVCVFSTC
jgi:hypothetical protein